MHTINNMLVVYLSILALTVPAIIQATSHVHNPFESLVECLDLAHSEIEIIQPTSPKWSSSIKPFNQRLLFVPKLVVVPSTVKQVSHAVVCAKRHKVKVQARSGGHSYAAMGLGGKDESLIINLNKFNSIEVKNGTAIVGSGVRLGNLALALHENGKQAMPHGLCPGVGVGGHALHGGFGLTSRMWGTALDNILELQVVLADGAVVQVSEHQHADIFWAFRGAGSSFGIVTSFTFKTYPAPAVTSQYQIVYPAREISLKTKSNIILAMQTYGATLAAKEVSLRIFINEEVFFIYGVYWGSKDEYKKALAPLFELLPTEQRRVLVDGEEKGWLAVLVDLNAGGQLKQPLQGYNEHDTFFAKSLVTPEDDPLEKSTLENLFTYLDAAGPTPPVAWWIIFDLYGGQGSQISVIPQSATSYSHRDSLFTLQIYTNPPKGASVYPPEGIDFTNGIVESITKFQSRTRFLAYANYVDPTLTKEEAWELYYGGGEQLEKLRRIKQRIDPERVFWNPQAIGA